MRVGFLITAKKQDAQDVLKIPTFVRAPLSFLPGNMSVLSCCNFCKMSVTLMAYRSFAIKTNVILVIFNVTFIQKTITCFR